MDLSYLLVHGFDAHDLALAVSRVAVGVFFAISGFHKLFVPERHARLMRTLTNDKVPFIRFMQWWVPGWEFVAGVMLAMGFMTAFSAVVLLVICLVACWTEAREKVAKYNPIDVADVIDDYLYLPEVLYIILLAVNLLAGAGAYSVDAWLFPAELGPAPVFIKMV
jgi:uncharacterized membrane protein YphA (DoxX/SURF4 family)